MTRFLTFMQGRQDLFLIGLLMMTILVMIVPLPTWVIDILIAANITLTLLVLIVAVYLKRPHDFTAFPAIILIATTFRLAITISTTRLILANADAGAIIDTFGNFVTQGSVIVGLVIFLIITAVQFIVVTKGSERVAEVAARFTLDGLPGRQMSIDSELRAGDITPQEAQIKRSQLEQENQFFGAMDGAMKFVKGDAIAGLIVVAINLLGGLTVGMVSEGMDAQAAIHVYSRLTVGDGLVSQIPALIVAMCAGTIITRVTSGGGTDLGTDIVDQLITNPKSMFLAAFLVTVMGFIPGFPKLIFFSIALALAFGGFMMMRKAKKAEEAQTASGSTAIGRLGLATADATTIESKPGDILSVALGSDLYSSLNLAKLAAERDEQSALLANRFGLNIPAFGVFEDRNIGPNEISVILDSVPGFTTLIPEGVAVAQCDPDLLSINQQPVVPLDPSWRMKSSFWVSQASIDDLRAADMEILEIEELIAGFVGGFIRRNLTRLVGYTEVQQLIRDLSSEHDNLATQISQSITAVQLLSIIRRLIDEDVPLLPRRNLFEALLEATVVGGSTSHFVEQARLALSRQICAGLADDERIIAGYILEPSTDIELTRHLSIDGDEPRLNLPLELESALISSVQSHLQDTELGVTDPVLLTTQELRSPIQHLLKVKNLDMTVLAFSEITNEFRFHPVGTIKTESNVVPFDGEAAA